MVRQVKDPNNYAYTYNKAYRKKHAKKLRHYFAHYRKKKRKYVLALQASYRKRNRLRILLRRRLSRYNISPEEYIQLFLMQEGRCAICSKRGSLKLLCVDHCHKSKAWRGLLCARCNSGLGSFRDNPHLLREAAYYLENWK